MAEVIDVLLLVAQVVHLMLEVTQLIAFDLEPILDFEGLRTKSKA